MRKIFRMTLVLGLAVGLFSAPRPARASFIELWGDAGGGTLSYAGSLADSVKPDFFDAAAGGAGAFSVGVHLLFIDGWINHYQLFGGTISGSYTQFMLGFGPTIDVGPLKLFLGGGAGYGLFEWRDEAKLAGLGGGTGMGTGGGTGTGGGMGGTNPSLTLVKGSTDSAAVVGEARFGLEYKIWSMLGLGVWGNYGVHYQMGAELSASTAGVKFEPVVGMHWSLFGGVRAHLGF